jgi:phospholipid transport system substrate-binding protein
MHKLYFSKKLIFTVYFLLFTSPAFAVQSPETAVKFGADQVLQLLAQYRGNPRVLQQEIRPVVDRYFDFEAIAKRALGPRWNQESVDKQQEFTREFSKLLFNTYLAQIEKYTDERIIYGKPHVSGDEAVVPTRIVGGQGGINVDYYVHLKDGYWKAYDVAIEGVGLVNNYRAQFNAILSRSSFDDLLRQLRQKVAQG